MRIAVKRFGQNVRNIELRRNVRRSNYTFANGVANPMVTNLNVFRAFVYRVVQIDQSDRALVVDSKIDSVVVDESEFTEESAEPGHRLRGMDSRDVFGLSGREGDRGLLFELHAKQPPLNMNANPEIDFRESRSFAKSASQYAMTFESLSGPKVSW